jgi:hypothetical protein
MKTHIQKAARQVSALSLACISVVALLLATGLVSYTERLPADSADDPGIELIDDPETPLSPLEDESSLAALAASLLVSFTFVLVWVLVFRPKASALPEAAEAPREPSSCG